MSRRGLKRALSRLALAGILSFSAMSVQATTLADTMTLAYRSSGLLDQNRALLRAADEDVAQAVSVLRPIVNWAMTFRGTRTVRQTPGRTTPIVIPSSTSVNRQTDLNIAISASLLLHDFGASSYAIGAAKETVLATRQSLIGVEQDVLLRAVQAHLEVRRTSQVLELRRSNMSLIEQELGAARDRFDVGEVTRTDVSYAEARLAGARAQLTAAEGDLARARAEYQAAVGVAAQGLSSAQMAHLGRSRAEAEAFALRNHPAVIEVRHNVAAAELNVLRAEASMMPTTNLRGEVVANWDENVTQNLSLTMGGPIYQGGRLSSLARQAAARRDQARAGLHVASAAVSQQVANAYALLDVTAQSVSASDQQVRAATAAFEGVREEAKLGARTTLDTLDAEQALLDARVSAISARIDRVMASYNALAAMGLLTAEHMQLPVTIYDPNSYYSLVENAPTVNSAQGAALDRVLEAIGRQ